jgi:Ni2+-binding GTPase involved in maturation of urease and hydrogenase
VIWVEGEAGSGKTALVRQAVSRLSSEIRVPQATANELSTDVEFAVVDQLAAVAVVVVRVVVTSPTRICMAGAPQRRPPPQPGGDAVVARL